MAFDTRGGRFRPSREFSTRQALTMTLAHVGCMTPRLPQAASIG